MSWSPQMILRETKAHFCAERDWNHKEWHWSSSFALQRQYRISALSREIGQSYKKDSLETVISAIQNLAERQKDDKIKAIYGSGSYSLSKQYSKFKIDSVKWHSMAGDYRRKYVKKFRMFKPTIDDDYVKPKKSGKKPSDGGKRIHKQQETEVFKTGLRKFQKVLWKTSVAKSFIYSCCRLSACYFIENVLHHWCTFVELGSFP